MGTWETLGLFFCTRMLIKVNAAAAPCLEVQSHLCPADLKHQRNQDLQRQCRGLENNNNFNQTQTQTVTPIQGTNNFKSIQTTLSLLDIKNNSRYCQELRSKSYENVRLNKREMQEEVLEWWQMHRDKTKMRKWGEKLQRLAEKLKKPGGEEKLRMKIVKYLKRVPSQLSECDDDRKEFREHLPDNIIRKLKKYYLRNGDRQCPSPVKVFRLELPSYCDKYSSNKQIIRHWLKSIAIKKRDFLGRLVKIDDISDYIMHKISPVLISKPDSEIEYKYILKSNLMDIVEELPIVTGDNKIHYLNKITDKLINNLLYNNDSCNAEYNNKHAAVDCQLDTARFIVPDEVIKDFVSGEITNFVHKSHICMSTKTMASIETELTNILTNTIYYINNIDESIKDDINIVLQDIGKLRSYQAIHLSNTLLENLKYFYRHYQKYLRKKDKAKCSTNSTSITNLSVFHNDMKHKYENIHVVLDQYEKQLIIEIDTWLESIQIPLAKEKEFRDMAVKDLADDIINSYKEVGTKHEINNQVHLKYHVLKWINKLTGKSNKRTAEYAQELMQRIANLPNFIENGNKLKLQSPFCQVYQFSSSPLNESESYIGKLTNEILDWYHDLPFDLYSSEDTSLNVQLIKDLSHNIDKEIKAKGNVDDVINREIDLWSNDILKGRASNSSIAELKTRLKNINIREEFIDRNPNLRQYEDLINKWFDTFPVESRYTASFIHTKNEHIHELAVKIFKIKSRLVQSPTEVVANQFNEDISNWLIKILLHPFANNRYFREKLAAELNSNIQNFSFTDSIQSPSKPQCIAIIHEAVVEWSKHLPLKLGHCPKELNSLIGQITSEIYKFSVHQEYANSEDNEEQIKREILKYLRGFPLTDDRQSEHYLYEMVNDLWDILKYTDFNLYRNDKFSIINNNRHEPITPKSSTSYLNTNDYLEKLTEKIEEWLSDLNMPQIKDNSYRQVVVNDLAQDIIDRHKYVKINPSSHGTFKAELEHLKYQIFKWINKLVGEKTIETIANASELMQKIRSIPVSTFMDHNQNIANECDKIQRHVFNQAKPVEKTPEYNLIAGISRTRSKGMVNEQKYLTHNKVKRILGSEGPNRFLVENQEQQQQGVVNRRMSNLPKFQSGPMVNKNTKIVMPILAQEETSNRGPRGQPRPTTPKQNSNDPYDPFEASKIIPRVSDVVEYTKLEEGTTLSQIYEQYKNILKNRCDEIPLATPTPEQESFMKITRQVLFNNIWKIFFQLKSDPEIENDYLCFEFKLEDRLDDMYDCLPETAEVQKFRQTWKAKVVLDVMKMLKKIHSITDSCSFRKLVANKIQRYVIRSNKQISDKDNFNYIILSTADQYVVYKKYQESDPIKANVYKQRLMKYIEDVLREYDFIKMPMKKFTELKQQLFIELDQVPIPGEDMLDEEVDEIMIGEEIEKWFNKLPLYDLESEGSNLTRERLRQLLAKKLHEWEKRFDLDEPSIERNMKHDVSVFLGRFGILQPNVDININSMVDDLANRLRARRQQKELLGYQSFERKKPLSSSLAPLNPNPVLSYLIAAENDRRQDTVASGRQTSDSHALSRRQQAIAERSVHAEQSQLSSGQLAGRVVSTPESRKPNLIYNQARLNDEEIKAYQRPCWTGKLGTSQVSGPSRGRHPLSVPLQGQIRPCNKVAFHLPNSNKENVQEGGQSCAQAVFISGISQVAPPSHDPNLLEIPIPSQPIPCNQIPITSPNGNLGNVQEVRSTPVQAVSVEHSASPQPMPSQGPTPGQGTRSTARILESNELQTQGQREVVYNEEEERAEEPNRCRCVHRHRCNKRRYVCGCDDSDSDDDPRYMNVPCRYDY